MSTKNTESTLNGQVAALSSAAVARRRILLKGVGKGAAVLAATIPIQTLATQTLLTPDGLHQCSISGMTSGVHSATPLTTPRCAGLSSDYWGKVNPAKTTEPLNKWPIDYTVMFNKIFSPSSLRPNTTLFHVMSLGTFASSAERHWVAAYLNALRLNTGGGFPYTSDEVVGFYKQGPASGAYQNALKFFTDFMETRNS